MSRGTTLSGLEDELDDNEPDEAESGEEDDEEL